MNSKGITEQSSELVELPPPLIESFNTYVMVSHLRQCPHLSQG
jgi:hypothetical protein